MVAVYGAILLSAMSAANKNNQLVGEKRDLYVTIEQLQRILFEVQGREMKEGRGNA